MSDIENYGISTLGPNLWDVNDQVPIEVSIFNINTGSGLTDAYVEITVQRASDNKYWDGYNWITGVPVLQMNEVDSTNHKGRYIFVLSAQANQSSDRYIANFYINSDSDINTNNFVTHVSRNIDTRFYDREPTL